jgi:transcriptional regulator with XRE-family HTH domain
MDPVRLGRGLRALRMRRGWRQRDLGDAVGLSQSLIARIERGHGDRVTPRTLERIGGALGARLVVRFDWNGEALDRLLDAAHAQLVEDVLRVFALAGWDARPEVTFAVGAERGSIDILGWHSTTATVIVVEIKSVVPDVQATLVALDRKVRLAERISVAQGWRPRRFACLLVIGDSRTSRRRVGANAATFAARFPDRVGTVRRFIAAPGDSPAISGLWFLSPSTQTTARHRVRAAGPTSKRVTKSNEPGSSPPSRVRADLTVP